MDTDNTLKVDDSNDCPKSGSSSTSFDIQLPPLSVARLLNDGVLEEDDEVLSHGMNRAVSWIISCDIAIVSAYRDGRTRKVNASNNRQLQRRLRGLGYGVSKVRGCFAEMWKEVKRENSFLVFDKNNSHQLHDDVFRLSMEYEQDCFLYKEQGQQAVLIGTNEEYGIKKRDVLGPLNINNPSHPHYSEVGSGRFSFG